MALPGFGGSRGELQAWLAEADIDSGPIFRAVNRHGAMQPKRLTAQSVGLIVKRCAEACGKDPADFGGHSLRSGHATQAAANGASERSIMNQTGHRSLKMVRQYIREGSLFRENAAAKLGL
ncbi:MAG: tyrosine-type recombinase/integrase [Planctomycetota bacterium]|nr:tyrosine-type recombinase/integrase [Planctomycetota bacterium]